MALHSAGMWTPHRTQSTAVSKCFANICRSVYQLKQQSVRGSNLHFNISSPAGLFEVYF
jgi:hypothetical protein